MKLVYKNLASKVAVALVLAMGTQFVTSCDKNGNGIEEVNEGGEVKLKVSIAGINEMTQSSNNSGDKKAAVQSQTKPTIQSFDVFDVATTVDNNAPFSNSKIRIPGSRSSSSINGAKAVANIGADVAYRLILYKADGTLVSSTALNSDDVDTSIPVESGVTYNWYAVSYNNNTAVPDIDPATGTVALAGGNDVLHAAGTIEIPATPTAPIALPIQFNHKTSRIAIELNSMGMFGTIEAANFEVSGLSMKTGTLDVKTGKWSNFTDAPQGLAFTDFTDVDGVADRKVAYAYTVDSSANNSISVNVTSLNVKHVDGAIRDFDFGTTPQALTPITLDAVIGRNHNVRFDLIESAISTTGSTVKWARSNLYMDVTTGAHNPYRFFAENKQRLEPNSYFAYGAKTPGVFARTSDYGDPCELVYPEGVWRKPTHAEFAQGVYVSSNGLLTDVLQNITDLLVGTKAPNSSPSPTTSPTGNYIQYSTTTSAKSAFNDASNNLRFYYNGQIARVNVLDPDFLTLDLSAIQALLGQSYGREGALWTKDAPTSILGLVDLGTWGYLAVNKRPLLTGRIATAQGTAELLSVVKLLGIDVASSTLKNIRCVRN